MQIISKLYYFAESFFVGNELFYLENSEALSYFKKVKKSFVENVKTLQKKVLEADSQAIFELKKYLSEWLKNNK